MNLPDHHAAIAALIPHQGRMCLLERVIECTPEHIVCTSRSHLQPDHPLRHKGRLSAVHLCEYGAQAVAVHGALRNQLLRNENGSARPGMLVALRDVQLHVDYLDQCSNDELRVRADCIHASESGCLYEFSVSAGDTKLASGKVTIANGVAG